MCHIYHTSVVFSRDVERINLKKTVEFLHSTQIPQTGELLNLDHHVVRCLTWNHHVDLKRKLLENNNCKPLYFFKLNVLLLK